MELVFKVLSNFEQEKILRKKKTVKEINMMNHKNNEKNKGIVIINFEN